MKSFDEASELSACRASAIAASASVLRVPALVADVEPDAAGEERQKDDQTDLFEPIDGDQVPVDVCSLFATFFCAMQESMAYSTRPGLPAPGSSKYTAAFFHSALDLRATLPERLYYMLKSMRESFHHLKWILLAVVAAFIIGFVYVDMGLGGAQPAHVPRTGRSPRA